MSRLAAALRLLVVLTVAIGLLFDAPIPVAATESGPATAAGAEPTVAPTAGEPTADATPVPPGDAVPSGASDATTEPATTAEPGAPSEPSEPADATVADEPGDPQTGDATDGEPVADASPGPANEPEPSAAAETEPDPGQGTPDTAAGMDTSAAAGSGATLRFRAVDQDGNPMGGACFAIAREGAAFQPCTGFDGTVSIALEIADEPVTGTFAFTFEEGPARCTPPSLADIVVEESDLGTVIDLGDLVFTCEEGGFNDCGASAIHTRAVTAYFGTAAENDGSPSLDGLQLTDLIPADLALQIEATYGEDRVADAILDWVLDGSEIDDIEWLLGTPDGLQAEQALLDAFAAFAEAQNGILTLDDPENHGSEQYPVETWTTFEENAEFCSSGYRFIEHFGYADVTFVELNATVEPASCDPVQATHERFVTVFYGTLAVRPAGATWYVLELSDHLVKSLALEVQATAPAEELTDVNPLWVDGTDPVAWVLAPPEGLDAAQAFSDRQEEIAAESGGTLVRGELFDRGTVRYEVATWSTFSDAPGCPGGRRETVHSGFATLHYLEQDAEVPNEPAPGKVLVRVRAVDQEGHAIERACFLLAGAIGLRCTDQLGILWTEFAFDGESGEAIFHLIYDSAPLACAPPELPRVVIDAEDAGTIIDLGDLVFTCSPGAFDDCATRLVTHMRPVQAVYGTVSAADGGASEDHLALSDRITSNLRNALHANPVDPRVTASIDPWVNDAVNELEWVLAESEGLDADGALLARYTAFAAAHGGTLVAADPLDRGSDQFLIATWSTVEESPGCSRYLLLDHYGYGRIDYTELNATVQPLEAATVQFRAVDQAGNPIGRACFDLTGPNGAFAVCTDWDGTASKLLEIEGEAVTGTFAMTEKSGPILCEPPELSDVVIEENDLGTTIDLGDIVFTCEQGGFDGCLKSVIHTRDIVVYYGTVEEEGGPSLDVVELSDQISQGLAEAITNFSTEPRVQAGVDSWVKAGLDDMSWVLGTPEGLDAEQALLNAFAAFADDRDGILVAGDPIDRGEQQLIMASWETFEDNNLCSTGHRQINNEGFANVTYVELNATVVLAGDDDPDDGDDGDGDADAPDAPDAPDEAAETDDIVALPAAGAGPGRSPSVDALALLLGSLPALALGLAARRRRRSAACS